MHTDGGALLVVGRPGDVVEIIAVVVCIGILIAGHMMQYVLIVGQKGFVLVDVFQIAN